MSDDTYAPKSPDLSSFYSAGPTSSKQPASALPAKTQSAATLTSTGAQPQLQELSSQQSPSQFSRQQRLHLQPPTNTYSAFPSTPSSAVSASAIHQQSPAYSPYFASPTTAVSPQAGPGYRNQQKPASFYQSYSSAHQPQFPVQPSSFYGAPSTPATPASAQLLPGGLEPLAAQSAGVMPPKRAAAAAAAASSSSSAAIEPSPVKTKFPTARIKRIMQADEEVGKVAQQTPIAVGKALEMFMIALVTKSAEVAREKNSKRVSAQMLKQVVESDDQWDFLREIVGRVENEEKAGKGKAGKQESESEEEVVEKKKRAGRKKKGAA
ncbi:hypothetical protein OQA88_114 [Cercophora sp. LCS_1]